MLQANPLFQMIDLDSCIVKQVSRDRDFGVIEAIVSVGIRDGFASVPTHQEYFARTWINAEACKNGMSHRSKLIENAVMACLVDLSRPVERLAA